MADATCFSPFSSGLNATLFPNKRVSLMSERTRKYFKSYEIRHFVFQIIDYSFYSNNVDLLSP